MRDWLGSWAWVWVPVVCIGAGCAMYFGAHLGWPSTLVAVLGIAFGVSYMPRSIV